MLNRQFLDDLSQKITHLLPQAAEIGEDVKSSLRQLLQNSFSELNLLTRDEFQASEHALQRARERVIVLEQTIAELEQQVRKLENEA